MELRTMVEIGLIVLGLAGIKGSFEVGKHYNHLLNQIPPNIRAEARRVHELKDELNTPILGKDVSQETFEKYRQLQREYEMLMQNDDYSHELRARYEEYSRKWDLGLYGVLLSTSLSGIGGVSALMRGHYRLIKKLDERRQRSSEEENEMG